MEIISRWIAEFISSIAHQAQVFWGNLTLLNFSWQQITLDILFVSIIFYFIFLLLKGSRTVHILIGLSIVAFIFFISKALQLVTLGWLLDRFLTVTLVAIPVIFQQELRSGLEHLGHTRFFQHEEAMEINKMILNIVEAVETLASQKHGALIVIQHDFPLKEYIDTGIALNARVSKELLLSIFYPKSPLHDGAVIIANENIVAAACLLPHSKNDAPLMGTRHKAALGLSETTDASIIVISEEKGSFSFVRKGKIEKNITGPKLHLYLTEILRPLKRKKSFKLANIFKK